MLKVGENEFSEHQKVSLQHSQVQGQSLNCNLSDQQLHFK